MDGICTYLITGKYGNVVLYSYMISNFMFSLTIVISYHMPIITCYIFSAVIPRCVLPESSSSCEAFQACVVQLKPSNVSIPQITVPNITQILAHQLGATYMHTL